MREYLPLLYLALALILAAVATRWFNWLAWGQRRGQKLNRIKERRNKLDGNKDDGSSAG